MRWPPRSAGRPLRDEGGASAGRPARVTGEGRGTLPQTRRENMPPDSAARQCRQEVTLQNLPSLGSFRCATCRIERRIGGVNGGDASRGRIEGTHRGDASRGRIEGADRGVRSRFPGRLLLRHHTVPVRAGHRHVTSDHEAASRPASRPVRERDRSSRPVPWLAPRRAIEPHAPPFSCQGHRATCTAVQLPGPSSHMHRRSARA